jgi:hypothetical protein
MSERTLEIDSVIDYNKNEIPAALMSGSDPCMNDAGE